MSLSHDGIGSLSRRKPFLLPSPGEQHVFSHQSRLLLPSNEHPFTQRKRHRQPLLPTPIHPPFAQQWRTFLPPFHVIHPFIQYNKIHLWRNRINNYSSPNYSWRHPSMMRNTGSQFVKRKCLLSPFKKQFTGHQNFLNIPSPSHKIVPIDFVRGDESDIIQDEMDTYSQSDKLVKLGEWEKHTKGIGAKLLLKMGFQPGKGLGKSLQGRTQPVEAMAPNGGGAIGSDKQVLLSPAQQSAEYSCQASNDLQSPSSYLIAATSTPEVICISSSDENDYLILHDDECLPEAPSPVCHTSSEANVMQTREKRLSELPWTYETLCSTSSRIPTSANSPSAVKPYSATSTESPDIVYISSSDEGECVVLYDSPRQR